MSQDFGTQVGRQAGGLLLLMGAIFAVVGIGLAVVAGGDPEGGIAAVIVGGIFGAVGLVEAVIGVVLLRKAGGRARVAATGLSGTARILGLTQTGMTLNDQPQIGIDLEVSVLGMGAYRVMHKEFVPLLLLARLQPGAVLGVRVDPADKDRIVIAWDAAPVSGAGAWDEAAAGVPGAMVLAAPATGASLGQVAAAMAGAGIGGAGSSAAAPSGGALVGSSGDVVAPFTRGDQATLTVDELRAWLRENGLSGTARIDRLEDSGQTVGDDRLFTMQATIDVPGHPPYRTPATAAMIPLAKVDRVAVGVRLPVKVASDNFDLCTFLWDEI